MIEVPRGALTADEIAQSAEFFSFGTNDLTQTALGMSRDDSGSFLPQLRRARDREEEPVCDDRSDGRRPAGRDGRDQGPRRPGRTSSSGICGEHGGDPASIHFFEKVGLDYVSCSPYRVPVARLAAAQAALSAKGGLDGSKTSRSRPRSATQ